MVWMQSRFGRAVEMVRPRRDQVDFREIAEAMSDINRFAGASQRPVSVALHTLIACEAAPIELAPWVLLHDAHATRIGDVITPVVDMLEEIADQESGVGSRLVIHQAIRAAKRRHDEAIHAAAGLPMPTREQTAAIHEADVVALMTERRDFLAAPPRLWNAALEAVRPLPKTFRWQPPGDVADRLYAEFRRHLPALAGYMPVHCGHVLEGGAA